MKKHELMELPYAIEALEPFISAQTLGFHHGKHLNTYVNNLNALLPGSGLENASLEEIVCKAQGGILNNAGQILNHNLYFAQFSGSPMATAPTGQTGKAITRDFGSFEAFQEEFLKKGTTLFGSGWVWLSAGPDGLTPLLTFDVWEHAYYLDYQNRRADHLAALWKIIDWEIIEKRLK